MKSVEYIPNFVLAILFSLLFIQQGYSQDKHLTILPEQQQTAFVNFNDNKELTSIDAVRTYPFDLRSADGSNFFNPNWEKGIVNFRNGKQYKDGELQFDFVKNELHFRYKDKVLIFAEPVEQFTLVDSAKGEAKVSLFRNGYPVLGSRNSSTFYEVLSKGKNLHLLRQSVKQSVEVFPYDLASKKPYKITNDWFLYNSSDNNLHLITPNASSIIKALPAYASAILQFTNGKKRGSLSEEEMIALVDRINNQ